MKKRRKGQIVQGNSIKKEALRIFENCNYPDRTFEASNGWRDRFLKRSNLALRRVNTSGRALPQNSMSIKDDFMLLCYNHINLNKVSLSEIINIDETSVYLDSPSNLFNIILFSN